MKEEKGGVDDETNCSSVYDQNDNSTDRRQDQREKNNEQVTDKRVDARHPAAFQVR